MLTAVRVTSALFILNAVVRTAASEGFPRVSILGDTSLCQEFTSFNGTPVRTRHHGNDCMIPTVLNPERNAAHEINIVFMAPGSGAIGDAMTQAEPYLSLALQSIEDNSSILPGYRVQVYLADDRCSAPNAAANVIRALSTGPPKHALVGPACSAACIATNDAVQYFNIPQISQSCTSLELSDYVRHPFFARLCPSYMNGVIATRSLLIQWRWFRVGVIHDHRAVSLAGRDVLLDLLSDASQHQWTVLMVQQVSNPVQIAETMVAARQRDARIITNVMYEDVGSWLLCETYNQKMLPPLWMQVAVSGWWSTSTFARLARITTCTKEQMFQAGYGWLLTNALGGYLDTSDPHGLSGIPIRDIHAQYEEECVKFYGTPLGCSSSMITYAYDAVWDMAVVFHKYLIEEGHTYEELNTPASQQRLFELILQADFLGLSGRVRQYNLVDPTTTAFRGSIGDREGPSQIRQVRGSASNAIKDIGHRFPDNSFIFYEDVVWSLDDPSLRVPCAGGTCDLTTGWVPQDGLPEGCPAQTIWLAASGCTPCLAGEFANGTTCWPCLEGTASNASGQGCTPCRPGEFNNLLGAESCTQCTAGRFTDRAGASACEPCDTKSYQGEVGRTACNPCGGILVTPLLGAESVDQCVCPAGTYKPSLGSYGDCEGCPEGLECPLGTDMSNPEALPIVQEGYYADVSLSVFKCLDDGRRCRRGRVGASCASGRHGRVCLLCDEGKAPSTDGTCKDCEPGKDVFPLIALSLVAFICLVLTYHLFDRADISKQSHKILLIAMTLSLVVTMLQQISSLETVSVAWPGPMRAIFSLLSVLVFDLEAFKVNCVVQPKPLLSFAMRMLVFGMCLLLLCLLHVMWVCVKHSRNFRERHHALISGGGSICLIFYVSIFISVLAPLQCSRNPNGLWTLKPYPSVICWEGDEEHVWMLIVGAISALLPVTFLARCCFVIWVIPTHMRNGNVLFLRAYAFLFFRYKPAAYWFSLVHLGRSLLVALSTIMPVATLQILLMQFVLLVHLAVVCMILPWRVDRANSLEAILTLAVLLMLCCAALVLGEEEEDDAMAWTFAMLVAASLLAAFAVAIHVAVQALKERIRKRFDFFICHHKTGTGCLARLLNVYFAAKGKRAFIDTDDLRELDKLFDYVSAQTRTLVVLCSQLILLRPWCLGEIVTACIWKICTVKVIRPDFVQPDLNNLDDFNRRLLGEDLECLTRCGIDYDLIQAGLLFIAETEGCNLPAKVSPGSIHTLCTMLSEKSMDKMVPYVGQNNNNPAAATVLVFEVDDMEASCTSFILASMLMSQMQEGDVMKAPLVLTEEVAFPSSADICLLLCTGDCLRSRLLLGRLREALDLDVGGIPVVGDESFSFPGADFTEVHFNLLKSVDEDPERLGNYIHSIFRTIASMFQPSSYGSTLVVLTAKAKDIAARLQKQSRGSTLASVARASSNAHGSTLVNSSPSLKDDGDAWAMAV